MAYGGNKYGGSKFGGGRYGGGTFGGNKYGASAGKKKEPEASVAAPKPRSGFAARMAMAGESTKAKASPVKGTVRDTGAGYTGAKGNAPTAPAKSAKMSASVAAPKIGKWKTTVKPAASSGSIDNRKPGRNRDELGAFYLAATENMGDIGLPPKKKR